MKNVLLAGAYGYNNFGDDLVRDMILKSLDSSGINIKWMSPGMKNPFGNEKIDFSILGGGGTLYDDPIENLNNYIELLNLGEKKIIFNIGIQGIITMKGFELFKKMLDSTCFISVRDTTSKNIVESSGKQCELGSDPGFIFEHFENKNTESIGKTVGLILHGYENSENDSMINRIKDSVKEKYINEMINCVKELQNIGYNITLFVMSNDDLKLEHYIQYKCNLSCKSIIYDGMNREEVSTELKKCEYIVTGRYHGAIMAMIYDIPFVMIGKYYCLNFITTKHQRLQSEIGVNSLLIDVSDVNINQIALRLKINSIDKVMNSIREYKDFQQKLYMDSYLKLKKIILE